MLADFFTKPLQGTLFRKLRAVVMGHAHVRTLLSIEYKSASVNPPTVAPPGLAKERVGQNEREVCGNREQGQKVSFELNPGRQTMDGEKSQAMTTTKKDLPSLAEATLTSRERRLER